LAAHKYQNFFFHGAQNGTMQFDKLCRRLGIKYFGLDEYPKELSGHDGHWGIADLPYLDYVSDQLKDADRPFFATIFTLSSHQPYVLAPEFEGRFPKGELPIHQTIGYADMALKHFFEKVQQQAWFENTLFIITADHTQQSKQAAYQYTEGAFLIPMVLYSPKGIYLGAHKDKVVQQTDILPSILDYVGLPSAESPLFGRSFFSDRSSAPVVYQNGHYLYFLANSYISTATGKSYQHLSLQDQPLPTDQASEQAFAHLKALIQYHDNCLINNNLRNFGSAQTLE